MSWVSIVARLQAGQPWFDSRHGREIFLLAIAFRPDQKPTQPPIQ
jgi:hypothetical protein